MAPKRKRQQPTELEKSPKRIHQRKDSPVPEENTPKTNTLPSVEILKSCLDSYSAAIKSRSQEHRNAPNELCELDEYIHKDLAARLNDGVSVNDFTKVFRWKLLRGKFRPLLPLFLKNNDDDKVRDCTLRAASIVNDKKTKDPVDALKPLVEMKGVGPATASAYLALFPSGTVPFFSDELAEWFVEELGPIKYTETYYRKLVGCVQREVEKANRESMEKEMVWSACKMEQAAWVWRRKQDSKQ